MELRLANFNIMSTSAAQFKFTPTPRTLDGRPSSLQQIIQMEAQRLSYAQTYIQQLLASQVLDLFSLEEVDASLVNLRSNQGFYITYSNQIYKPSSDEREKPGDWLITYINSATVRVAKNYTKLYQQFYAQDCGNTRQRDDFEYPCRSQIFLLFKGGLQFVYVHIHGPGMPEDSLKASFYQCLSKFLVKEGLTKYPLIILGDFNETRPEAVKSWLNLPGIKTDLILQDITTSQHNIVYSEGQYQLKTSPEEVWTKVDQLWVSSSISIEEASVVPQGGMLYKQPYAIDPVVTRLEDPTRKTIKSIGFISRWLEDWISDHALLIYRLIVRRPLKLRL